MSDFSNFLEVQTKTAWGRTLAEFASFCIPPNRRPELDEGRQPQSMRIALDIGTGPGLLPDIFRSAGHLAFGLDTDHSLLSSIFSLNLTQANALHLPFQPGTFNLITATNLLFLLDEPLQALREWARVLTPDGQLCLLNPSENLSVSAAEQLADTRGLEGIARESLLNWAHNAETHLRWTEPELHELLAQAGLRLEESLLKVGPGFARFTRASLL